MTATREQLLEAYAALPEAYQPAWGIVETAEQARRGSADRFALVSRYIAALPGDGALRVLDIGCAQGYFSLGLCAELKKLGRTVEMIGADSLESNVRFCERLAGYHGIEARFIHGRFDEDFFAQHQLARFDAILALNVLHHIRQLQGGGAAEDAALATIRAHSRVLFCEIAQAEESLEWVDDWHESDHGLLRGYAFRRRLGEFKTHLTKIPRPLYACSDELACVDGRWFGFARMLDRAHPGVSEHFAGQRRFFIGSDTIVKAYRTDGDFGEFNRTELTTEAEVLKALADEPRRYPALLAQADDGDTAWLARGLLPGRLLSESIEAGDNLDPVALARALLVELARLEQRGLHHADLRAWNVLCHGDELRLIDFGSMVRKPHPLHRVALAAVIRELADRDCSHPQPWYEAVHPLENIPGNLVPLLRYLYGAPQAGFSHAEALQLLDRGGVDPYNAPLVVASDVLQACAEAQCKAFARVSEHAGNLQVALAGAAGHAESLDAELKRVTRDAITEHATAQAALADAAAHAQSLDAELKKVTRDAVAERAAAQAALADAADYNSTLQSQRRELEQRLKENEQALARMQARFRAFKAFWPREQSQGDGNEGS